MEFGELGIICRIVIDYYITYYLSVNISVLIIWMWEESSASAIDFCSKGRLLPLSARTGCVILLWPSLGLPYN